MNNSTRKKILIFIPAYNVEKQILRVLKRIPIQDLSGHFIQILIIEDRSKDDTKQTLNRFTQYTLVMRIFMRFYENMFPDMNPELLEHQN